MTYETLKAQQELDALRKQHKVDVELSGCESELNAIRRHKEFEEMRNRAYAVGQVVENRELIPSKYMASAMRNSNLKTPSEKIAEARRLWISDGGKRPEMETSRAGGGVTA